MSDPVSCIARAESPIPPIDVASVHVGRGRQMTDKHISSQFDAELNLISTKLLEMGGLVESQLSLVLELLNAFNASTFSQVVEGERHLDKLEVEIDD